jgi:hypothetical protein
MALYLSAVLFVLLKRFSRALSSQTIEKPEQKMKMKKKKSSGQCRTNRIFAD